VIDTTLATWGLSLALIGGVNMVFGNTVSGFSAPLGSFAIGRFHTSVYDMFLVLAAVTLSAGMWVVLRFTPAGLIARGTMQNASMAAALGVAPDGVYAVTFAAGAALSGLAGGLIAPLSGVLPTMGTAFIAKGYGPAGEENPRGAWYVKTKVDGAATGKLKGKTIVLKDNICLVGVPMNGASTLEGYVPDIDATVATRILDVGGTIVGKSACEYFIFSGGSHTSASGPVHNPHRMGYSAGGSSSGSACLVKRVHDTAGILGIEDLLRRKPRQLPGGQRQRVALGRAITQKAGSLGLWALAAISVPGDAFHSAISRSRRRRMGSERS